MGFQPLTLSLRMDRVGGAVNSHPDLSEFNAYRTRNRLLLLIHGFNNDVVAADNAYNGFFEVQRELANLTPGDDFSPDRNVIKVYWPGDDAGATRALYYPESIGQAEASALVLANVLLDLRPDGVELEIIAHSMGCRLALELMRRLPALSGIRLTRAVFMAAAVPTFMLEDWADATSLHNAFERVCLEGGLSLYSTFDAVLADAFPIGQTMAAGREGFFPVALGHDEWRSPHSLRDLTQIEDRGAGHSDYWGQVVQTREQCARPASEHIRQFLGFPRVGDRPIPSTTIPDRRLASASLPVRELVERNTPARPI